MKRGRIPPAGHDERIVFLLTTEWMIPSSRFTNVTSQTLSAAADILLLAAPAVRKELEMTKKCLEESKLRERLGNDMIVDLRHELRNYQLQHRIDLTPHQRSISEIETYLVPRDMSTSGCPQDEDSRSSSSGSNDSFPLSKEMPSRQDLSRDGLTKSLHMPLPGSPVKTVEKFKTDGQESGGSSSRPKAKVAMHLSMIRRSDAKISSEISRVCARQERSSRR
eukprot:764438-Hanusia_phi.AAC.3